MPITTYSKGETLYTGRVIRTGERNGYDDSDFYAVVMDDNGDFVEVVTGSTRWYGHDKVVIDATPEVREAYRAHLAAKQAAADEAAALREAARLERGVRVRVVKGRKVPKGTEGTVVWIGVDQYGSRYGTTKYRIGIRPDGDGEAVFTAGSNVVVLHPERGPLEPSNAVVYDGRYHRW